MATIEDRITYLGVKIGELRAQHNALELRIADLEASRTEHGKLVLALEQRVEELENKK